MSSQAHAVQSPYSFLIVTAKASKVNLKLSCTRMFVSTQSNIQMQQNIAVYLVMHHGNGRGSAFKNMFES